MQVLHDVPIRCQIQARLRYPCFDGRVELIHLLHLLAGHGYSSFSSCVHDGCLRSCALDQKECTSSLGAPISAAPFGSCACAIASGLKVSRSNLISPASATRYPVNRVWSVRPVAAARACATYSADVFFRVSITVLRFSGADVHV